MGTDQVSRRQKIDRRSSRFRGFFSGTLVVGRMSHGKGFDIMSERSKRQNLALYECIRYAWILPRHIRQSQAHHGPQTIAKVPSWRKKYHTRFELGNSAPPEHFRPGERFKSLAFDGRRSEIHAVPVAVRAAPRAGIYLVPRPGWRTRLGVRPHLLTFSSDPLYFVFAAEYLHVEFKFPQYIRNNLRYFM